MSISEITMIAEAVLIGILLLLIVIREIFIYRERQKLLDRIMARNYEELIKEKEPEYRGESRAMTDEKEANLEEKK